LPAGAALFNLLDSHQRSGQLPWQPTERRELHLTNSHIKLAADRRQMAEWERFTEHKVFQEFKLSEVSSISYLDDVDKHYLLVVKGEYPTGEIHVIPGKHTHTHTRLPPCPADHCFSHLGVPPPLPRRRSRLSATDAPPGL